MWENDPLIATVLMEHRVTCGVTLADNVSRLIELAPFEHTLIPQQHLHTPLYQLSCEEMRLLFSTLRTSQTPCSEVDTVWDDKPDLLDLRWDLELLPQHGITHLSQWKEGMTGMSEMSRGALKNAVAQRPFISFVLLSEMSTHTKLSHLRKYIAQPIIRLLLHALRIQDEKDVYLENDHGISRATVDPIWGTQHNNILYSAIKSAVSDEDKKKVLEEAWEEAVVSSLPLTPRTCYSTVVMAVVGTHVRIGLLTLWEVGADLQHLPAAVKEGLGRVGAAYVCNDDSRACDDLKLLHVIEFCAVEVQTNCFDDVLLQYFSFIGQNIHNGAKIRIHTQEMGGCTVGFMNVPENLRFLGCHKDVIVKAFKDTDTARLRAIHKKVGHPIYRCGVFNTQYSKKRHQHACCIYDYIDYKEGSSDVSISNASNCSYDELNDISSSTLSSVCVAIINLHDTLHVCHGDITSDNVIIDHGKWKATLINYECAVDSIDTKPNANLPSVKALRTFLASMDPAHRKYVKADYWLFHRLADVLAVFQHVLFNHECYAWDSRECEDLEEVLRAVVAPLFGGRRADVPPQKPVGGKTSGCVSSASCVSTKGLMLAVLTRWGQQHPRWLSLTKEASEFICEKIK